MCPLLPCDHAQCKPYSPNRPSRWPPFHPFKPVRRKQAKSIVLANVPTFIWPFTQSLNIHLMIFLQWRVLYVWFWCHIHIEPNWLSLKVCSYETYLAKCKTGDTSLLALDIAISFQAQVVSSDYKGLIWKRSGWLCERTVQCALKGFFWVTQWKERSAKQSTEPMQYIFLTFQREVRFCSTIE